MQFRQDINGLRAIAVITVVLFHFNATWLPGGFVGVDIFFVISGYLMTAIIMRGLANQQFSFLRFYLSRGNRLIPALAALCLCLLIFGFVYLLPKDYKLLSKHVISSLTFLSNFSYWAEAGYFDTAAREKWLLHTWSLSVEWQFYLLYPLILVFLHRYLTPQTCKYWLGFLTFVAFMYCAWSAAIWPDAAYYLLATRMWELLMGAMAFVFPLRIAAPYQRGLTWLGLVLILISSLLMSKATVWPGYMAMLPVFAAFLVIQGQDQQNPITHHKVAQKLGLWSYSIYLWHWPIMVMLYYIDPNPGWLYAGIAASIFMGYLSYRFVEKAPLSTDGPTLLSLVHNKALQLLIAVGMLASVIYLQQGRLGLNKSDYTAVSELAVPSPLRNKCHTGGGKNYKPVAEACTYFVDVDADANNVTWAVVGDSHVVELAYALADYLKPSGQSLKHFSFTRCVPAYLLNDDFTKCAKWANEVMSSVLADPTIKTVVINYRYSATLFGDNDEMYPALPKINPDEEGKRVAILNALDNMIFALAAADKQVIVLRPVPEIARSVSFLLARAKLGGHAAQNIVSVSRDYYTQRNARINAHFDHAKYPDNVSIVDPSQDYCDLTRCWAVKNGIPLYFDEDHPSIAGAALLVPRIMAAHRSSD